MSSLRLKCSLLLLLFLSAGLAYPQPETVRIGYVSGGPYYYYQECWDRFKKEMKIMAGSDFQVLYPAESQLVDNWDPKVIVSNCRKLLADPEVDIIVGMGLRITAFFAAQTDLPKPVVLFGTMDIEMAGLETEDGLSTVKNLTFQVQREKIADELAKIKQLAEDKVVSVLVDPTALAAIPDAEERADELARQARLKHRFVAASDTVEETLEQLPPDTEFIYLTPSHFFNTREEIEELVEGLNRKKIPTFALEGAPVVEMGALAGLFRSDVAKIAKNNALKVYEIIKGEPPERQSVYFRDKEDFTINMATARRIGYYPGFDLLMEARLINEEVEEGPLITVRDSVIIALKNNLNYRITRRELEEEEQEYKKTLANLLPQLEASANYQRIDSDRAKSSMGLLSRWETAGSLKLDQLIFDYSVWKSVTLAERLVMTSEVELEQTKLDTAEAAVLSYLDVLQAQELVRIQKENLESNRNHLSIAQVRLEQEAGSREDVLRWEAEYQSALASLIEASMALTKASLAFNETLNRPQEAPFRLEEIGPEEGNRCSAFGGSRLDPVLTNWKQADLARTFLVEAGQTLSPEVALARLNVEIAEEDLTRSRAEIWSPTVGAQLEYTRNFGEEVWNADGMGGGTWSGSGPYPDDNEWSVVGYVTLPLWSGGSNWADLGQKEIALRKAREALRLQEQSTALSIRTAFFDLVTSSTNWELDRERERLTGESLKVVEDKYQKGVLPIIDLLDAQTEYVSAQAAAVSSFYSSISDLVELQRDAGLLEYVKTPAEVEECLAAMENYIKKHSEE